MALTYLIINLVIILGAIAIVELRPTIEWRRQGPVVIGLVLLTAVFDNVIVGSGLVAYDPAKISGWYIGVAPVEDFFYAIAAGLIVPAIWQRLAGPARRNGQHA